MYKILVRPVLAYDPETWVISKAHDRSLGLFQRRVFEAVQDKGTFKKRYNRELYKLFNKPDIPAIPVAPTWSIGHP
jgi:hypothetical protein